MVSKLLRFCWLPLLLTGCTTVGSYFPSMSATPGVPISPVVPVEKPVIATGAPQQVALLLPAQGGLVNAAQAIQAGFNDAYQSVTTKPLIKNEDTTQATSMTALYQQAVSAGADRVVGPLSKENVGDLANHFKGHVLTIALNSVPKTANLSPYFYQFSLSPTDEARQVADKASADGYHAALLITPAGAWGENIANVLTQRFQANGGAIVGSTSLSAKTNVNAQIHTLLQVNGDNRRQDFDVVFMIVQPLLARQIKPLLKYYNAANIPVYSTSLIYTGVLDSAADRDLDGVEFCDMPLVIDQQGQWAQVRQNFTLSQPGTMQSYIRLYGLGWDAALLTQHFDQLTSGGIDGATGHLYSDSQQHILRKLRWATFQQGIPVPLT